MVNTEPNDQTPETTPRETRHKALSLPITLLTVAALSGFFLLLYITAYAINRIRISSWLEAAPSSWVEPTPDERTKNFFFCSDAFEELDSQPLEAVKLNVLENSQIELSDNYLKISLREARHLENILSTLNHRAGVHVSIAKSSYAHSRSSALVACVSFLLATIFLFIRTRNLEVRQNSHNITEIEESSAYSSMLSSALVASLAFFVLFWNLPRVFLFDENLTNHLGLFSKYIYLGREVCYSVTTGKFIEEARNPELASQILDVEINRYLYSVEKRMADLHTISVLMDRTGIQSLRFNLDTITEVEQPAQLPQKPDDTKLNAPTNSDGTE